MIAFIAPVFATKGILLLFGGDIMLNGIQPSDAVFRSVKDVAVHADIAFANLEIPLTDSRTRTTRKLEQELKKHTQWILKANPKHAPFIAAAGFSAVSLANNHAMDYGPTGLTQMIAALDAARISHAGAGDNVNAANRPCIKVLKDGAKVAMLSALGFMTRSALLKTTPATVSAPGIAVLNLGGQVDAKTRSKLERWVDSAKKQADYVVVAMHWGIERKPIPTAYQVALGRALIDAGADVVWGNHPHVLQGAELYKGKLIMYSMGNLISSLPAETGFFELEIHPDRSQSVSFIPAKDSGGKVMLKSPHQAPAAVRAMRTLCRLLLHRYPCPESVPAL